MGGEKLSCISLLGELLESPPQCGEKMGRFSCTNSVPGSPPRRRGKTDKDDVSGLDLGITPAGRGKELVPTRGFGFKRITPAWAGKSSSRAVCRFPPRDHPRVGGEKGLRPQAGSMHRGSPPRGRGKESAPLSVTLYLGITPAWAGKSTRAAHPAPGGQDHPRVGGEKIEAAASGGRCAGSPPRGRGKVRSVPLRPGVIRITPAWAGKRRPTLQASPRAWDHPRMGGEKLSRGVGGINRRGSPPHGRGKASELHAAPSA